MFACAKAIVFLFESRLFCLFGPKTLKIVFEDFESKIFSFFGSKIMVNNLATVESITWPHFCLHFWGTCGQLIDPTVFIQNSIFFCFQKSQSSCRKNNIFEKQKGNETNVARLLTLQALKCGQVIDPTAHIYIYTHTYVCVFTYVHLCSFRQISRSFARLSVS